LKQSQTREIIFWTREGAELIFERGREQKSSVILDSAIDDADMLLIRVS